MTCIHLGDKLRDEIGQCCGSKGVRIPVFTCAIHGETSQQLFSAAQRKQKDPVHYCATCEQKMEKKPTSIVILYSHKWAQKPFKDELRWALRSLNNIQGAIDPIVVGDPPAWYTGKKIEMPTVNGKYVDTTAKIRAAAESPLVSDPFVLWMDDTCAWSPIELSDVMTPRYARQGIPPNKQSAWAAHVFNTLRQCESFGYSLFDTATHFPYTFGKRQIIETIDKFQAHDKAVCLEVAHDNMHSVTMKRMDFDFLRVKKFEPIPESVKVLNYANINPRLRAALAVRFPNKCTWELDEPVYTPEAVPPRALQIATDACAFLGAFKRQVPNPGKGRSFTFQCNSFNDECTIGKNPNVARNCVKCPVRQMRGSPLYVEVA